MGLVIGVKSSANRFSGSRVCANSSILTGGGQDFESALARGHGLVFLRSLYGVHLKLSVSPR
jgi:hypothetical protein